MADSDKKPPVLQSLIGISIATSLGAFLAIAGSDQGLLLSGLPAFALLAVLAFGVQWAAFVPAFIGQSERYYDLVGSLTYLSVVFIAVTIKQDWHAVLLASLIACWALRLGSFLFLRIQQAGKDRRFDKIKPYFFRFLMTWTLQGLWVLMTAGAALAAMTSSKTADAPAVVAVGVALWVVGFAFEVVADRQKSQFRSDPANEGRFICVGLWAWCRHPNYFGEIVLWLGIAVIAYPALQGWQYFTLVSPLFVFLLLTRVSGVPMLDAHAKRKWGNEPEYQAYRKATPVLFPRPPKNTSGA